MIEPVIVSAARTPIGSFRGVLSSLPATRLGSIAIREVVRRAGIEPADVDEVIMGNVLPAGLGQAPARQATLGAGLPKGVTAVTLNKVCGSGLEAVMLAANSIRVGDAEVVVAGGMESMSGAPYLLEKARDGYRMGDGTLVDSMIKDGLWDPYNDFHMGRAAELCAEKYELSREDQDAFTVGSYEKALKAQAEGSFSQEIIAVEVPQRKGDPVVVSADEEPGRGRLDRIPTLRPAFKEGGTVTAANASSINDGAAAVVVMSAAKAEELGLTPLARITAQAAAAREPEWFTIAPADAIQKVLDRAGLSKDDIDLFEINEAFSVVSLAVTKLLELDHDKINVKGGAVALGHPIGASGTRILVTLLYAMKDREARPRQSLHRRRRGRRNGRGTLVEGGVPVLAPVCAGGARSLLFEIALMGAGFHVGHGKGQPSFRVSG